MVTCEEWMKKGYLKIILIDIHLEEEEEKENLEIRGLRK